MSLGKTNQETNLLKIKYFFETLKWGAYKSVWFLTFPIFRDNYLLSFTPVGKSECERTTVKCVSWKWNKDDSFLSRYLKMNYRSAENCFQHIFNLPIWTITPKQAGLKTPKTNMQNVTVNLGRSGSQLRRLSGENTIRRQQEYKSFWECSRLNIRHTVINHCKYLEAYLFGKSLAASRVVRRCVC